uniref:Sirtuin 3 n=1 Tax=Sparus aurata TaxID=8175 RepID=A0A671WWP6_SPAAU
MLISERTLLAQKYLHVCFAPSQTNTLSPVDRGSGAFLPWRWRCRRGAADSGGRQGGGDGWSRDQHAEWHPRFQVQRCVLRICQHVISSHRSPGSGLYDNLQQYDLPYAEAIFEIGFFRHNPNPFFALAKELYPGNYQPNLTHYFVRLLHEKKQLLRMYTQNIDGLERLAGIPPEMLVEAHGTFATATCTVCRKNYKGEELRPDVMSGTVPKCPTCTGVVKPDIVFFGEELPRHFFKYLTDFPLADLLIVMGTSLEVEPFASLAGAVRGSVPRLLINRDLVGPFAWRRRPQDVVQLGDVVGGVQALVDALGWTQELDALMAAGAEKVGLCSHLFF